MADKFRGFWMMEAGERDEQYLHPATPEEVATQLEAMGYVVASPCPSPRWSILDELRRIWAEQEAARIDKLLTQAGG